LVSVVDGKYVQATKFRIQKVKANHDDRDVCKKKLQGMGKDSRDCNGSLPCVVDIMNVVEHPLCVEQAMGPIEDLDITLQ
jgi:hypothetical protein